MRTKFTPQQDKEVSVLYLSGKTAQQIADIFRVYKQSVLTSLKRSGISRRKEWQRASGANNGAWRGGIRMVKGYRHIYRPKHHLARKDGWVAEHRVIAEKIIGRRLKRGEVVHHRDENKVNNAPSNLMVYASNAAHLRGHAKGWKRDGKGKFFK